MDSRRGVAAPATAFCLAMVAFALCAHRPGLWWGMAVALLAAGAALALGLARAPDPKRMLALRRPRGGGWAWLAACIAFGAALGVCCRWHLDRTFLPHRLTWFCAIAAGIGLCEEVAYRGFVQGALRPWGVWPAVLVAAVAHAAYKGSLFLFPPHGLGTNVWALVGGTFLVGALFGLAREKFGGLAFPAVAHVAFDIVTYGDLARAPWWV